jgi:integrase
MKTKSDYLWRRGGQWWLRIAIPRHLRHRFPASASGKHPTMIAQPLGDSASAAKAVALRRAGECLELFRALGAGEPVAPERIAAVMRGQHPLVSAFSERYPSVWAAFQNPPPEFEAWAKEFLPAPAANVAHGQHSGETISQAAEAWIQELTAKGGKKRRDETLKGHRDRVRRFVKDRGDLPLADVTRDVASDFLTKLKVNNRTRNNYAMTLKSVFKSAGRRGRFSNRLEDNPFDDQRADVDKRSNRVRFKIEELQTLFPALPRDIAPKKHTPETALSWAVLIALYTGARLEEIAQLNTADIREAAGNGSTITVIDIHNGGDNKLKNEWSARLVPVHSALVRAGFLDYVKALPAGPLFPGLVRRASKGNKVGARLGELFRKKLVALGMKREGLCFHSLRHTVANTLDRAEVRSTDVARILGQTVEGEAFGTYSQEGPGLKVVAGVVEKITYEGLNVEAIRPTSSHAAAGARAYR